MGYRRTSSYIQNLIRNIPAAYELLPTTRSTAYVQVNGVDQTATNARNILKQRSWANIQNGSGLKPMMNTARNFHANLMQSNNQHYALSAGRSVFITSTGYTTVQKVNYDPIMQNRALKARFRIYFSPWAYHMHIKPQAPACAQKKARRVVPEYIICIIVEVINEIRKK